MRITEANLHIIAWFITIISVSLAVIVWGQSLHWHIIGITTYLLFPIFGLVAFSIMWSQYISIAFKQYLKIKGPALKNYFRVTSYLVLVAILIHPSLLIWQLWRDGAGLPPSSYVHYVLPNLKLFVILGSINLTIFLLFELRRIFSKYSWWRYYTYIVDIALLSVFYHGLRLGTQLRSGWYQKVWYFYGISYVIALGYIYRNRYLNKKRLLTTNI